MGKNIELVVSFSGGETSAFMLGKLLSMWKQGRLKKYKGISVVFANTGLEHKETLIFVKKVGEYFDIPITWLESKVHFNQRKASTYKVVDFDTADRKGLVFENVIKKYGIPNVAMPHCTRELKMNPIKKWCVDNFGVNYEMAIGIRLDERHREPKKNIHRTVYPLIEKGYTKEDVIKFWRGQSFRLGIENYQGNCQACYKKSDRKLMLIAHENPVAFDFMIRMEKKYPLAGCNKMGVDRVFFRGNRSAKDILKMTNEKIEDSSVYFHERDRVINDYNNSLFEGGCSESCEAFVQQELPVKLVKKRTKEFLIEGGRNEADVLLSTTFKVNTPKQAQTRFTNKYGAILVGYWFFSILDHERQTVGAFEIGNKVVTPDDHVQVDLFNKDSNKTVTPTIKASNKTVTPNANDVGFDLMGAIDSASSRSKSLLELKKEQEKMLKKRNKTVTPDKPLLVSEYGVMRLVRYQLRDNDGHLQHWTGRGRRPMWLEDYIKEGGDLSAIRVNQGFEQDFDTKEVRRISKERLLA